MRRPATLGERIAIYKTARAAQGLAFDSTQVAVARQLYVAKNEADKQDALKRQAEYTKRTIVSARRPDAQPGNAGSHVLAYADKQGATEENALFGTPDEIAAMLEALQHAGVEYILLTIAGGRDQLRRFAREIMPAFTRNARRRNSHDRRRQTPRRQGGRGGRALGLANDKALEVAGQGTKRAIGRPSQTDLTLDLSGLTGVTLYEPAELVLSARAGTPLAEIEAELEMHNQQLAFEPIDYGPLFGGEAGPGTIGGVIAANLSGPRRIKAGAARDHFLGVTAVTGRGDTIKSGGRVVKNVTGYDLCKLFAGSWGTLAAMTDITIKVLPKPETEATVLVQGLDDARACAGHGRRHGLAFRCLRRRASARPRRLLVRRPAQAEASTALRLEGHAPSVAHRKDTLAALMAPFGPVEILDDDASRALWRSVRTLKPFATARERPLWRISVAPARGHELAAAITPAAQMFYDWAGGLIWVAMPLSDEPDAAAVRGAVAAIGGHATLIRAPASVRAALDVFAPEAPAIAALKSA